MQSNQNSKYLKLCNDTALKSSLLDIMKKQPYSLVNDATSNTGLKKMNPVCCQIFDVDTSTQVEFQFYMCATSGEHCLKSSTLSEAINRQYSDRGWISLG